MFCYKAGKIGPTELHFGKKPPPPKHHSLTLVIQNLLKKSCLGQTMCPITL